MNKIKLSALELAPVKKGGNPREAIQRVLTAAQHIEKLGYERMWLAEHHNMEYIACTATVVLISHIAEHTTTLRVGSGGIMLPNHAPLVVAEQFGTLETLYPGRIDLGLGRAPGTDQSTAMALRRNNINTQFYFADDVKALQQYFSADNHTAKVRAFPAEGREVPIWILGSSTDSAYLAAELGLPYAFASHFAPAMLRNALEIYQTNFKPSHQLQKPYSLACVNVIGADTTEEAQYLSSSLYNMFSGIVTNTRRPLSPPTERPIYAGITEIEQAVQSMVSCTFVGDEATLSHELRAFAKAYNLDEIMTTSYIYDDQKRLRSYEVLARAFNSID
jgi:luciferase family oxidoreductase group 1